MFLTEIWSQPMTQDELIECRELGRMIAAIEVKRSYWEHQRQVAERVVEKLVEKSGELVMRQKALTEGKAAKAAG